MPVIKKRSSKLRFEFVASRKQSTLGGLPAVESLAQEFGSGSAATVVAGPYDASGPGSAIDLL